MGYEMPERPRFLERALQGIAFWIGHRHSLFSAYPLPEAALVTEACNLIQANLSDSLLLLPEYQYKNLIPEGESIDQLGKLTRADLVICSKKAKSVPRGENVSEYVNFVIEVKRATAAKSLIDDDLKRLFLYLDAIDTNARCFFIVISESKSPTRFVSQGKARLGTFDIPNCSGCFHVRRVVKASASFSNKNSAHYACLIEVFKSRPKKLPEI